MIMMILQMEFILMMMLLLELRFKLLLIEHNVQWEIVVDDQDYH